MPASYGKRNSPPPKVSREEIRAFAAACAKASHGTEIDRVDSVNVFTVMDYVGTHLGVQPGGSNQDNTINPVLDFELKVACIDAVKRGLEAAWKARLKLKAQNRKPRSEPQLPELPAGWAYAAVTEIRPKVEKDVDHGSEATVIVRRGALRVIYQDAHTTWGGVGAEREAIKATLYLDRIPNDAQYDKIFGLEILVGRLTPQNLAGCLNVIRDYLRAPELQVEHIHRRKTLLIPEAALPPKKTRRGN